jgi:hypothetical protein
MHNTKVIENFETFPERTNMSPSDKGVKSYGHWNLEKASVLGRSNWLANFGFFRPVPNEIWKDSDHEDPRKFYNLSNEG